MQWFQLHVLTIPSEVNVVPRISGMIIESINAMIETHQFFIRELSSMKDEWIPITNMKKNNYCHH